MPSAPGLIDDKRAHSGYGRNTPTPEAKHAYSTQQTEDKARRLTAELTGMHVEYKAALRLALPEGTIHPAEATDLGPSLVNCIRSAPDVQEAIVEATMVELEELASKGSPSAAVVLGSFQPGILVAALAAFS